MGPSLVENERDQTLLSNPFPPMKGEGGASQPVGKPFLAAQGRKEPTDARTGGLQRPGSRPAASPQPGPRGKHWGEVRGSVWDLLGYLVDVSVFTHFLCLLG